MSPPEQNVPSDPVITTARTDPSASIRSIAAIISIRIAIANAFFRAGWCIVNTTVAPRRSSNSMVINRSSRQDEAKRFFFWKKRSKKTFSAIKLGRRPSGENAAPGIPSQPRLAAFRLYCTLFWWQSDREQDRLTFAGDSC